MTITLKKYLLACLLLPLLSSCLASSEKKAEIERAISKIDHLISMSSINKEIIHSCSSTGAGAPHLALYKNFNKTPRFKSANIKQKITGDLSLIAPKSATLSAQFTTGFYSVDEKEVSKQAYSYFKLTPTERIFHSDGYVLAVLSSTGAKVLGAYPVTDKSMGDIDFLTSVLSKQSDINTLIQLRSISSTRSPIANILLDMLLQKSSIDKLSALQYFYQQNIRELQHQGNQISEYESNLVKQFGQLKTIALLLYDRENSSSPAEIFKLLSNEIIDADRKNNADEIETQINAFFRITSDL